jgi:hypothetical protein
MSAVDVNDFLEHHGVKGMKWGQRKQQIGAYKQKAKKTAKRAAIGAGIGVGVAVAVVLASRNQSMRNLVKNAATKKGEKLVEKTLTNSGKTSIVSITRKQRSQIRLQRLNYHSIKGAHEDQVRKANLDLKRGYDKLNTPIPNREFV